MSEPTSGSSPSSSPTAAEVRAHLHTIASLLREVDHLGPEAQQLLAELVDELSSALETGTPPHKELGDLANQVARLVRLAHESEEPGVVEKVRDRLESAAAAVEAQAPMVAGLTRRLIETLSNLGI